jgi:hypothetical protein
VIKPGEDVPPLSWDVLHSMMASSNGWSEAWRQTGDWALDVLEGQLGPDWPELVRNKNPTGGAPMLAWAAGHVSAYVSLVELALRLDLLKGCPGFAKARTAIRSDPRPGQLVASEMQLEVAGLALRIGCNPTLEPSHEGCRPADIAFETKTGEYIVEARAVLTSAAWEGGSEWTDALFEDIRQVESRYAVRCEGEVSRVLNDDARKLLLEAIETRAQLVAAGLEAPRIVDVGASLQIYQRDRRPAGGLRGPELHGDSWSRIAGRIREKVDTATESGANWLRLDARNGLWQFSDWATRPLMAKAELLETVVRDALGTFHGIIASCGSVLRQGDFSDESVTAWPGVVAVRRTLPFVRVRETVVVAASPAMIDESEFWREIYANEATWLDWALAKRNLPTVGDILNSN